ncbi:type II secretion system minor pseudopilin GspI [Thiomicrorhabdus cannonii]|uniref:type II secretion system minor pseudopilin GspI n=1 Tax=Thiomicrorhabdus cannonii TaxID=2748011 RepID=UPI0015BD628E|nr:type II secretion system minor pseudopilin GspI [Thiomicrorhabdus cannonii]
MQKIPRKAAAIMRKMLQKKPRFSAEKKLNRPGVAKTQQAGFTLIEVLVALAVAAIALAALSRAMGLSVNQQSALEERVVASWVAQDELVKLQVLPASRSEAEEMVEQFGRQWQTRMTVQDTLVTDVKKVVMEVRPEGTQKPSATLVTVAAP